MMPEQRCLGNKFDRENSGTESPDEHPWLSRRLTVIESGGKRV